MYADADLLEVALAVIFAKVKHLFEFDSKLGSLKLPALPKVRLSAQDEEHDLTLIIPAEVSVLGLDYQLKVYLRGWVSVDDGVAQLRNFDIDIDTSNHLVEELVNSVVDRSIASIASADSTIKLPRVEEVFGRDLNACLCELHVREVHGRPFLCFVLGLGSYTLDLEPEPLPENIELEPPPDGVGNLVTLIPEHLINELFETLVGDYRHDIRRKLGPKAVRVRLKGSIFLEPPEVKLRGGQIQTDIEVRFRGLKGGMQTSLLGSKWIKIRMKRMTIGVDLRLQSSEDGRQATIRIASLDRAKAKFKGDKLLDEAFKTVIKEGLSIFNRGLANKIEGKEIKLLDLPSAFMGGNMPVKIRLGPHGLGVQHRCIVADLRVSAETPPDSAFSDYWQYEQLGRVRTHLRDRGEGQPIVFIPDLGLTLDCFAPQLEHFNWRYRPVAYEWRGQGKSSSGRWPYRMTSLVKDLRKLVAELDIDNPILCGQGMGAAIALRYALRHPGEVEGVVIIGNAGRLLHAGFPVRLWQGKRWAALGSSISQRFFARRLPAATDALWTKEYQSSHSTAMVRFRERYLDNSILATLNAMRARRLTRISLPRVARLGKPILTIRGPGDEATAKIVAGLGAQDVILERTSAMPTVEAPEEFNAALEAFVERVAFVDEDSSKARRGSVVG